MACTYFHTPTCDQRSHETSRRLYQTEGVGWVVSLSMDIEVWGEHSDIDELIDAPGDPIILLVEDLYTLHGDLVAWPPIKVQVL